MQLPTIDGQELKDKRVLLRLDFDYLFENGFKMDDNHRFNTVAPLIGKLINDKAKTVIAANCSNIKKAGKSGYTMERFADIFCEFFKCEIYLTEDRVGQVVNKLSHEMVPGNILLLNNLDGLSDEKKNNRIFANRLSEVSDIYINEAVTLSHLELASTNSILENYDRERIFFGSNFVNVYTILKKLTDSERPAALFINTSSVDEGIEIVEGMIQDIDKIFLIGNVSDAFLKFKKGDLNSKMEVESRKKMECFIKSAGLRGIEINTPVDYMASGADGDYKQIKSEFTPEGDKFIDIGNSSGNLFSDMLSGIKKLIWFGEFPAVSESGFPGGTLQILNKANNENILSIGVNTKPVSYYRDYEETGLFNCFTDLYETVSRYLRKEELPIIKLIEGKLG